MIDAVKAFLEIITSIVTVIAVVSGGLWAYTKFVVERGLIPPVEFTVDCNRLGTQHGKQLIEVLFHIENVGGSILVIKDYSAKIRYISSDEEIKLFRNPDDKKFGRANFPNVQTRTWQPEQLNVPSEIPVVPHPTFVQPKVDQVYYLVTAVPQSASFLLVSGEFHYAKRPPWLQRKTIKLSRCLGLIQYSLDDVDEPHTVQRAFRLGQVGAEENAP